MPHIIFMCRNSCSGFCTREKVEWKSTCLILPWFFNRKWENKHRKKGRTETQGLADQRGSNQTPPLQASWLTLSVGIFLFFAWVPFLLKWLYLHMGFFYMALLIFIVPDLTVLSLLFICFLLYLLRINSL